MKSHNAIGRRQFLRIIGAGSVAGLAALALGRGQLRAGDIVSETRLLMGTLVNLTLVTSDLAAGRRAIAACLNQIAALEAIMSRHQPGSQLSRLNHRGYLDQPDAHLLRVLRTGQRISALSAGAFDVTIKPLADLYQQHYTAGNDLPADEEVQAVLSRIGYRHLAVEDNRVSFVRQGMGVTLDGIAKGYIVDEGTNALRQHGFDNILVEAGGDLAASGKKFDAPWQIGLRSPRARDGRLASTFRITNRAAATSGDYMQPYSSDFTAHHIIDPRTGRSAPEVASATVTALRAIEADALATALMVMDSRQGLALVESLPGCEAYLITKDLQTRQSSGWV
jgi:FAD:protein FMN transferase